MNQRKWLLATLMIRISGEEYFWQFYISYGQGKALKVKVIVSKWEMHLHSNCLCRNFNGFFHSGGLSVKLQMPRIISWLFTIGDNSPNLNEVYHSPQKLIPRMRSTAIVLTCPDATHLSSPRRPNQDPELRSVETREDQDAEDKCCQFQDRQAGGYADKQVEGKRRH